MICLFAPLRKYLELFRPCFSHRQWKYFVTVLLGLSQHKGRHTLKGLLASVWDQVSLSGLSRLLGLWSWSPEKLAQTWQADFRQEMAAAVQAEYRCQRAERPKHRGRPKATLVTGYLIIDECPSCDSGRTSTQSPALARGPVPLGHYRRTTMRLPGSIVKRVQR